MKNKKDKTMNIKEKVRNWFWNQIVSYVGGDELLSLLGENESVLSDTKTEHDPLHSVRECNAERVEQEKVSVKNPLGKITDAENICHCGNGFLNNHKELMYCPYCKKPTW